MTFFISDLHFGFQNILSYDARPFMTVEDHDNEMIRRWNDTVGPFDEVWILGDISHHNEEKTIDILRRLNGTKRLCIGNHDLRYLKGEDFRAQFAEIVHYKEIEFDDGSGVVLCHYPIPCYNKRYQGWYHLYGHVHTSFDWNMMKRIQFELEQLYERPCRMFNVGAMVPYIDYTPRTLCDIAKET